MIKEHYNVCDVPNQMATREYRLSEMCSLQENISLSIQIANIACVTFGNVPFSTLCHFVLHVVLSLFLVR